MKRIQIFVIVLLLCSLVFLYFYNQSRVMELQKTVGELQGKNKKMQDEYETQIALLKAGNFYDSDEETAKTPKGPKPAFSLKASKLSGNTFSEMKKKLKLNREQAANIQEILRDYREEKQSIFETVKKGNELQVGSFEYLKQLKKTSEGVYEKLKKVLNPGQYELMIKNSYDLKLGIRIPEKLFSTPQPTDSK